MNIFINVTFNLTVLFEQEKNKKMCSTAWKNDCVEDGCTVSFIDE